ncbi:MAG: carbohydrate ABC transporter permease [Oscillospiraceae bacterium]|nr:carbohydrate ABC transporter permease [Oscillospiraceae bacterium]
MDNLNRNMYKIFAFLCILLLLAVFIVFMFPIYWIATTSVKDRADLFANPPNIFPVSFTLNNFAAVFGVSTDTAVATVIPGDGIMRFFTNSVIVTSISCAIALVIGTFGAYGLVRVDMPAKRKKNISFFILSTRMLPPISAAVPLFLIFNELRLVNTHVGLIIAHTVLNLAFVVWMMQGFLKDIPSEIHDAASVDGCGPLSGFLRVVLPLAAPGLVVTVIFISIFSWNEFALTLVLSGEGTRTIPVFIASMWTSVQAVWGEMAAAAFVATLPVLILAIVVQKNLIRGLTFGAIK